MKVVAVVAPHSTEAPETVVQPWNVEQSTQPPSFWAYDLNTLVLGVVGRKPVYIQNIFPPWFEMTCILIYPSMLLFAGRCFPREI